MLRDRNLENRLYRLIERAELLMADLANLQTAVATAAIAVANAATRASTPAVPDPAEQAAVDALTISVDDVTAAANAIDPAPVA